MNEAAINAGLAGAASQASRKISGLRQRIKPIQPKRGLVNSPIAGTTVESTPIIAAKARVKVMATGTNLDGPKLERATLSDAFEGVW